MKKTQQSGRGFCEELSFHVYEDVKRQSILVNVDHEWISTLVSGMERRKYKLVHVTEMPKTLTCVFTRG